MRYLEVGGYFKTPQFPIWVVGSTSHFTVMFGDASCLQESESDIILEKCRRAFKTMEGGAEENGFIQVSQLSEFLEKLDLNFPSHSVQMLGATMEVHGAGIMLWEDLWKRVSRLLTGATLETVLGGEENTISEVQIVPAPTAAAAFTSTDPNAPISDEELARRLHAEWNGESLEPTPIQTNTSMVVSSPPAPAPAAPAVKPETYGQTYQLYHYNGLRGTFFKAFRITRLSADEAIGASVSLGASSHSNAIMGNSGDLESVLRTKWPSCKINWLEGSPPSID